MKWFYFFLLKTDHFCGLNVFKRYTIADVKISLCENNTLKTLVLLILKSFELFSRKVCIFFKTSATIWRILLFKYICKHTFCKVYG